MDEMKTPTAVAGSEMEKVCAVVVTFNRKGLLANCLRTLYAQTRPPDCILVVNNASTDGTAETLARDFPDLTVLTLATNSGGAGGFHAGMKWAYEAGYDWLWIMDDDIEMYPTTLAVMLEYRRISQFIHVRKVTPDGPLIWEGLWDLGSAQASRYREDLSFKYGKPWTSVNYANFEGALIHRAVVEHVGYPDTRYFLAGDDSIYGFLASLHTNVIYVNHVGIERKLPAPALGNRNSYYFCMRNRFLTYEHLRDIGARVSRLSFWTQNVYDVLRSVKRIAEHPRHSPFSNLAAVFAGLRDGVTGRFGPPPWLRA